ncbi:MAG: tripartite tricarboxylate transporter substrate binding protein [Syntrophales bacterium]|nr:tripartite tricarboxylate transporter substrate binding protein [Syntrophales bacterium]
MKNNTVRILWASLMILSFAIGIQADGVWAQSYPTKPIKIIVPFPPGNTTDIMSRLISPKLQARLGQPIIVENRPGASGMIGTDLIAKSLPDGYTLGASQAGLICVLPHTSKNVPYNVIKEIAPLTISTTNFLVIFSNPKEPFKTLGEMITYAKANPGKLTVSTNGEGSFPHLAFEHLRLMTGITYNHIPYKGNSEVITAVLGGQVQVGIGGILEPSTHIKSGRLNLIAPTGKARAATWPDKPTAGETVPGYESGGWFGFIAPAGTPREILKLLNKEINLAMDDPAVTEKMVNGGMAVANESLEHAEEVVKRDHAKYGKLVKDIGFKPQ